MPKFELRFDIAAILLAGVLTALGISAANAGGASGGVLGDRHAAGSQHQAADGHDAGRTGGRVGGGGDCCSRG